MANETKKAREHAPLCSFCCKPYTEVETLVAGPGVFICNECVSLCADLIGAKPVNPSRRRTLKPPASLWDQMDNLDDIVAALPRVAQAGDQVEDTLAGLARRAHGMGASWTAIGEALGVTRQWAWQRFSVAD